MHTGSLLAGRRTDFRLIRSKNLLSHSRGSVPTHHLREELRDYFNCMNRLDEGIGMVLEKLGETGNRDNTLVIYISDHGADFPRGKGEYLRKRY